MLVRRAYKDKDGNMTFDLCHGFSSYKTNQYAIEQDIYTALHEFQNNCFFALNNGIDWLTRLGYPNQKAYLDVEIPELIANREGVLTLDDFSSSMNGRVYTCSCNVWTIYSETPININFSTED